MQQNGKWKGRIKKPGFFRRILLLFLTGFFCGGLFYYIFQNSFSSLLVSFEGSADYWSGQEQDPIYSFVQVLWNHGKYFALLWLLAYSRIKRGYQMGFTLYTGVRNGFLLMFFLFAQGSRGILIYVCSLLPQCLIFVPLYLFCFVWINENREIRYKIPMTAAVLLLFVAACMMESRWNLPLMRFVLQRFAG